MSRTYAEGGNYRIELEGQFAYCRVWSRFDVSSKVGASFAREKVAHFAALVKIQTRGLVLDLRSAPPVTGPNTQEAIGEMLAVWEAVRRPVAIVSSNNDMQLLQLRRLVASHAARSGSVFLELEQARAWIAAFR